MPDIFGEAGLAVDNGAAGLMSGSNLHKLNHYGFGHCGAGQTTDATPTIISTLATEGFGDNKMVKLVAEIGAYKSDQTLAWSARLTATARRTTGAPTIIGTPVLSEEEGDVGFDTVLLATVVVSGNTLAVQVTGIAATTINWGVRGFVNEAPP